MSEYTDNLNLFKYNTETDGNLTFNIDLSLNDNWDILDTTFAEIANMQPKSEKGAASGYCPLDSNSLVPLANIDSTTSITSGSDSLLTSGGAYTYLVRRLNTSSATGNSTTPVYVDSNGQIQQCSRSIPVAANAYVTATYSNGASWYRKWSDKFCEQGGIETAATSSTALNTTNFLVSFKDTNYTLLLTGSNKATSAISPYYYQINTKETSYFKASGACHPVNWYAAGFTN